MPRGGKRTLGHTVGLMIAWTAPMKAEDEDFWIEVTPGTHFSRTPWRNTRSSLSRICWRRNSSISTTDWGRNAGCPAGGDG